MPSYDIRYRNDDGTLEVHFAAECATDTQAMVLAHAMKAEETPRIEVWEGSTLIYERPTQTP